MILVNGIDIMKVWNNKRFCFIFLYKSPIEILLTFAYLTSTLFIYIYKTYLIKIEDGIQIIRIYNKFMMDEVDWTSDLNRWV